jgi:hypothetical protein
MCWSNRKYSFGANRGLVRISRTHAQGSNAEPQEIVCQGELDRCVNAVNRSNGSPSQARFGIWGVCVKLGRGNQEGRDSPR